MSAGDNGMALELLKRNSGISTYFLNDISWSQLEISEVSNPKIFYSNHDAIKMPFREQAFDLAICMNTLHHMEGRDQLEGLLNKMTKVAKNLLIWEIMKPSDDQWFPRLLNRYYYEGYLGDQGNVYFNTEDFQSLIGKIFSGYPHDFGQFKNVQGTYNYATISTS